MGREQQLEDAELLRRQLERPVASEGTPSRRVDHDVTRSQHRRDGGLGATHQRTDTSDEHREVERLRQVVVGAEAEPADQVVHSGRGGEHQHPAATPSGDKLGTDVIPVHRESGYRRVELLVGENVSSQHLKEELTHGERPIVDRIASEVECGSLRILVPKRTIHSKFCLLGNDEFSRLIVTSANLTETARRATAQTNYAWYMDVPAGHPMLIRAERDYQQHCEGATVFMGDLVQLLKRRQDLARGEVISIWLGTESGDPDLAEARAIIKELVADALAYPGDEERPVIHFELPKAPESRRQTLKLLTPALGVDGRAAETRITPGSVIRYVEEAHGVPLLRVDVPKQEVLLGFRGALTPRRGYRIAAGSRPRARRFRGVHRHRRFRPES